MSQETLAEQFPPPDWRQWPPVSDPQDADLILYDFPDSVGCQQVRLALAEIGLRWRRRTVNLLQLAELEPDFVKKTPRAQLPLLEVNGYLLFDTSSLLMYLDERFDSSSLTPADPVHREEMVRWLKIEAHFPLRELSSALQSRWRRPFVNWYLARRLSTIKRLTGRHPSLSTIYEAQLTDTRHWVGTVMSAGEVRRSLQLSDSVLQRMNQLLQKQSYLAGDALSLADVVWAPVLHRMQRIGMQRLWDEARLPALAAYLQRMQQRPSFAAAIKKYEQFVPRARVWLPVIVPRLTVLAFLVAAFVISFVVLLGT